MNINRQKKMVYKCMDEEIWKIVEHTAQTTFLGTL